MIYRNFCVGNEKISLLGMGCMRLPGGSPENRDLIDMTETAKMIDYAYKHGVNYFDTAYAYHGGNSEKALGEILKKYPRESFYIADKFPVWHAEKKEDVEKIFNTQLERLQVDYIDFYLMHGIRASMMDKVKELELYDFMKRKQAEGKIKYIGFSFHDTPEALQDIINTYEFQFAQIQYNYFDYYLQRSKEQYEILEKAGLPTIIMEPVRGGFLASVNENTKAFMENEHPDWSVASWAIRYAAAPKNILCVLSGMTTMEQLKDNISVFKKEIELTEKDYEVYRLAYENILKLDIVPCTQCRYCMDCPAGVDIPTVLHLHNDYIMANSMVPYRNAYRALEEEKRASSCVGCKACEELCPQKINISEQMERINTFWKGRSW